MLPYIANICTYIICVTSLFYIIYQENHGKIYNKQFYILFFLVFILFGTFAYFGGDYEHYKEEYIRLSNNPFVSTHLEPIYVILAQITQGNYHLWRFCIFLTIFLLFNHYIKIVNQNNYHTLLWFALFILPETINGRSPLSILSYFICILYFIKKKRLLGFCFLLLASITHKSILPLILIIPLYKIKLSSKYIPLLLIFFPTIAFLSNIYLFDYLIDIGIIRQASFEGYSQKEYTSFASIGGFLQFIIIVIPYNCIILIYLIALFRKRIMDTILCEFYNFCLWFILLLVFLLILFGFYNPIFYRYYDMLKYPLLLLLPYTFPELYHFRLTKRNFYIFLYFFFSQIFYISLYSYYQYCG